MLGVSGRGLGAKALERFGMSDFIRAYRMLQALGLGHRDSVLIVLYKGLV